MAEVETLEAPKAPAKPRSTKVAKMEQTLVELVGRPVRLSVVFVIKGAKREPQEVRGLLMAVGTKMGPWDGFTTPTCAVVKTAEGQVLIVSARSVAEAVQDKPTPV